MNCDNADDFGDHEKAQYYGDAAVQEDGKKSTHQTENIRAMDKKVLNGGDDDASDNKDTEGPVSSDLWGLIEQFLQQKKEWHPRKKQQLHWNRMSTEAESRLDRAVSTSSYLPEENVHLTQGRRMMGISQLTPHTQSSLGMSGRSPIPMRQLSYSGSTPNKAFSTFTSNNQFHAFHDTSDSTIPSWNFITRMLQRHSKICTNSCESLRTQPFLERLHGESKMRCQILERVLNDLKTGSHCGQSNGKNPIEEADNMIGIGNEKGGKRDGSTMQNPFEKRLKLDSTREGSIIPPLSTTFLTDYSDKDEDADLIMETQIKLGLWSSLLSSVKEIFDTNELR